MATDPNSFNNGVRTTGGGRPYVNGNRKEGNNFLLDGVDNNQTTDNLSAYQPNLDAIAEFKMITNNASAEFGNFQGGIINVVIKSGTNQFHGNVFEYFRNDKLNANNWGRNWTVGQNFRSPIRWNQFGGTFGGPIKKDKLFFFADYQGLRRATPPSVSATTVMPAAWRQGDFSNLLNPAYSGVAAGIQLYNPYSENATTGARAPFPNNQIPVSLFNPVIKNLFANTVALSAAHALAERGHRHQLLLHVFELRQVRSGRYQAGLQGIDEGRPERALFQRASGSARRQYRAVPL